MDMFQIESVESPLNDRSVYPEAVRVLVRTQMMGLWNPPPQVRLDSNLYYSLVRNLQDAGIAKGTLVPPARPSASAEFWAAAWRHVRDAVDESPHPAGEWKPARELLGDALLAEVLDVSESSLRRYSTSARTTPDNVAWRLHAVGQITSALAGSYNEYGIRRWFTRSREQLGGLRPVDLLVADWSPDDDGAIQVIGLAEALLGAGTAS
jgi:hypothetical protein